jgi:hypothetical protein
LLLIETALVRGVPTADAADLADELLLEADKDEAVKEALTDLSRAAHFQPSVESFGARVDRLSLAFSPYCGKWDRFLYAALTR